LLVCLLAQKLFPYIAVHQFKKKIPFIDLIFQCEGDGQREIDQGGKCPE